MKRICLLVFDQNIIALYNPSTAFDVTFLLLELLTDKENTKHVKRQKSFA